MNPRPPARILRTALLLAAACFLGLPAAPAAPGSTLAITLPDETAAFEPSPLGGYAIASAYCVICHSADYVRSQPPLPRATWKAEVAKMKKVFGAPLTDDQLDPVVDYLARVYGAERAAPQSPVRR